MENNISNTEINNNSQLNKRWSILLAGVITMLFAGVIYAWSILKVPLSEQYGWSETMLALNYTFTAIFFCTGGFVGSRLSRLMGVKKSIMLAALFSSGGIILTGVINSPSVICLFITYALMAGGGIGIAYNVLVSTISAWFTDKKGLCSGALMMSYSFSTFMLGKVASRLFDLDAFGWRRTYVLLGIVLGLGLLLAAFTLRLPPQTLSLPQKKKLGDEGEAESSTPGEMLKSFTFWRAFLGLSLLSAVGSTVISLARDLALSFGASVSLATTLVGVLAICNGFGRILTGIVFDTLGRRITMIGAGVLTVVAAAVTLVALLNSSLVLGIIGLCLTGMSYGTSPTVSAAFTASFYGPKHFATNFSIMNFNLVLASFVVTLSSSIMTSTGGYIAPFILLVGLALLSLALYISIKKK